MTDGTTDFSEERVARWEVLDPEIKQSLREDVEELVEKYHTLMEREELDAQSEEDVKVKFLNPLLEALGWDVRGIDEVKFEQRTLSGRTDFGLRTSRDARPSIFYELKSFDESLDGTRTRHGDKMSYAEVAIEDAWQMKVEWAVLTNFEKFRLYYTLVDSPQEGLVAEWSLKDPPTDEELEQLWDLSKPRIKQGSLSEYDRRRTRQPITDEVVDDLYEIRTTLSDDIREHNDDLSTEELRESVQRILDRLVVIRTAEDRGIISPGSLDTIIESWDKTKIDSSVRTLMRDLRNLFRDFDAVYNSECSPSVFECRGTRFLSSVRAGVWVPTRPGIFNTEMSVIETIRDAYLFPPLPPTNENPRMDELMPIEDPRQYTVAWLLAPLPAAAAFAFPPSAKLHPVLALIVIVSMLAAVNAVIWGSVFRGGSYRRQ